MDINYENVSGVGGSGYVNVEIPDECPSCHHKVFPDHRFSLLNASFRITKPENELQSVFVCTNSKCKSIFIAYYKGKESRYILSNTKPKEIKNVEFSENINKISPDFIKIYNEAYSAEQHKLTVICGSGYRKALEFLVKDYLIKKTSSETEQNNIKEELLGKCINEKISDLNIKNVAKRAAWLGNDEVHYLRKWENKDLQDLKKLIDLTVHWMEAEALTVDLLTDMPE